MTKKLLVVPYKSQGDPDAPERNDCGPTCVAMVLAASNRTTPTTEVYAKTGATGGLISASQLQVAAQKFGLTLSRYQSTQANSMRDLHSFINQGTPVIALIKYAYLPGRQVEFADGHFVVVVGYDDKARQVFIHDPLYSKARRDEGAYHPHTEVDWGKAWGLCKEDNNTPYLLLVPDISVPFVTTDVDLPMARRRVFSRLAYDGQTSYEGKPFEQLADATIAELATRWTDWPAAVDEYTVAVGEGKRQVSGKVYGTWKRWAVLQYYNDLSAADDPPLGVLKVPRPTAYVQPSVTRWGGLKVRPLPEEKSPAIEKLPAHTPVTLLSVPLTVLGIVNGEVQTEPWINQPGDVWVRLRSPFGKEGWARWRYAQDNETYLDYKQAAFSKPFWGAGKCLAGIGVANPWPFVDQDYGVISTAHMEIVKLLAPSNEAPGQGSDIARRLCLEGRFVMARLFEKPGARRLSAKEFVASVKGGFEELYKAGVRYFEVHNEPNLPGEEGLGVSWADGAEFGAWFIAVCNELKALHSDVRLGYPGLSPQENNPGLPPQSDTWTFLSLSEAAVQRADWIGVHCYWQHESTGPFGMLAESDGMLWKKFRARWPNKLLFITEFSNNSPKVDDATKGQQYGRYYSLLRREPNLGGAIAFALYWPGQDKNREGWRTDKGGTKIPGEVGQVVGLPNF